MSFSKMDYCQFLLSSQVNYTLTHLAEHVQSFSHDTINRYLSGVTLRPRHLWEKVSPCWNNIQRLFCSLTRRCWTRALGQRLR